MQQEKGKSILKIKKGEYIRTTFGDIFKYEMDDIDDENYISAKPLTLFNGCYIDQVKKHSEDIIDLIEQDDYINGCKVSKIFENGDIQVYTYCRHNNILYIY